MAKKASSKKGSTGKVTKGKGKAAGQKAQPTSGKKQRKKEDLKPWQEDIGHSLANIGLRVKQIQADGNCFFRACADQLKGSSGDHMALRRDVVRFMREHEDDFAPYMEDGEAFDPYCDRMDKDGTWAGLHEQVALTRLCGVELRVYQAGQPCWTIHPDFPEVPKDAPALHLSYHNEEHYNSVRLADDYDTGPPQLITLVGGKVTPTAAATAAAAARLAGGVHQQLVERVMHGTGCNDKSAVLLALKEANGSADEAIELLVERLAHDSASGTDDKTILVELPNGSVEYTEDAINISTDEQENNPPDKRESPKRELLEDARHISKTSCTCVIADGRQKLADSNEDSATCTANGNNSSPEENGVTERMVEGAVESKAAANDMLGENQEASTTSEKPLGKRKQPSRNRPCVCGSGRRYKTCCGAAKAAAARRQKAVAANAAVMAVDADITVEQLSTLYI